MRNLIFSFILLFFSIGVLKAQTTQEYIPTGLQSQDIDINNATLSWNAYPNSYLWQVEYKAALAEQFQQIELTNNIVYLTNLSPSTRYTWKVRVIDNDGDTSQWSAINYFYTLSEDTLCPQVSDMYLGTISNNSMNIQWLPADETDTWQIVCGEVGSNPENYDIINQTQNYEYTFNQEFTHGNKYQFAMRTNCQGTFSQWQYLYARYLNEQSVYNFPIQIDFEDTIENTKIGMISSMDNPWGISTSINATSAGHRALHITNGSTYACNPNVASVSYAYIDFEIPYYAESFYIDFSYHTFSQLENAGLKVYLLSPGTSISIHNLPPSEYQVGEETYRGTNNQWLREHIELPPQYIGSVRRLLFVWYNTSEATTNHSVAIDDIYLTARYCAVPENLEANSIASTSAILTWDFAETQNIFNLQYKKESDTTWISLNEITPNHLLENLQPSTTYEFRVQADCIDEQSFWSEIFTFTTSTLIPAPENLRIDSYTHTTANLSWQNNLSVEQYEIEVIATTNNSSQLHQTNLNTIQLTQLLPNTIYQIKVRAISSMQDTSVSSQVYLHTLCYPEETFPYILEDTIQFSTLTSFCSASECWRVEGDTIFTPMFNINSLSNPYLSFNYSASQGINSEMFISIDGNALSDFGYTLVNGSNQIPLIGYVGNNTIRLAIHSTTYEGEERTYTITDFSIKDTCLSPESISVNQITYNSAYVEWQSIDNITSHDLKIINLQTNDTITETNVQSPYVATLLNPMQEYKVILYSTCGLQQALNSVEAYFTTLSPSETCLTPENFVCQHYQVKGDETIVCTWDGIEDSPYAQWEINYKERYAVNYNSVIVSLNPRFTLRNLNMGDQYDFRLRAICSVGDTSSWTEVVQVTVGEQSLNANLYSGKSIKIFPNPSDTIIYVETDALELKDAQLIDSYGRVIRAWDILPREINISTIEAGNYILKFTMDNQPVSRKITIQ